MQVANGKFYLTEVADTSQLFLLIKPIPLHKYYQIKRSYSNSLTPLSTLKKFQPVTLLFFTLSFFNLTLNAQAPYSKEVEEEIKLVEQHLAGSIKIEGIPDDKLSERMAYYKVKGLSIAVIKNYQIVWAKGYGWADEEEQRPVTTVTMFEPGSISKSISALGILKLTQEKKLDLNTDINDYLQSWKFPYDSLSGNKKITLKNLLSHTAGLSVHGFPGYNRKDNIPTLPQLLDGKKPANTGAVRSEFEAGLKFKYSGGGTTISQLLLSDVTHIPYDKFMAEQVLKPLGMDHSSYTQPPPVAQLKSMATGYHADGSMVEGKFHVYPEQGAAGLWTTPTDICKYIIETQLALEGKSSKVLNRELTALRLTPYLDKSSALGVFIEERGGVRYFQHGAANEGFRGMYYGSLEGGDGVAVFVNSDNHKIISELINSVATIYNWKGFYSPVIKKEIIVDETVLQKYTGIYVNEEDFSQILKKDDGLYLYGNGTLSKMHFSNDTLFFNLESPLDKHFMKDKDGNVKGFTRTKEAEQLPAMVKVMRVDTLQGSPAFFNSIGWYSLENKFFDQAIAYLQQGLNVHPGNLLIKGNLAHGYLFKGDYEEALKIYKQHGKESVTEGFTWEDMILQDFAFFKEKEFDDTLMQKVAEALHLKLLK